MLACALLQGMSFCCTVHQSRRCDWAAGTQSWQLQNESCKHRFSRDAASASFTGAARPSMLCACMQRRHQ